MEQESDFAGYSTLKDYICSGLSAPDKHAIYKADILIRNDADGKKYL